MERNDSAHGRPIAAVARLTGLSADTIRAWERRYGLVRPGRDAAGMRRYSDAEIVRLQRARKATESGHPIRIVAAMSENDLTALLRRDGAVAEVSGAPIPGSVVETILGAIREYDAPRARRSVNAAALLMEPCALVLDVFVPLMHEVGRLWQNGEFAVWQEHLLSGIIASATGAVARTVDGKRGDGFLFATPPGEQHSFGIAFAAMIAAASGFAANDLGPNVPAADLIAAARRLQVRRLVVGAPRSAVPQATVATFVHALENDLPEDIDLIIGGPVEFQTVTTTRAYRIGTLSDFVHFVDANR